MIFLSAIACPRYDENRVCTFDGKIGIWPFIQQTPVLRNSIKRPAGIMIMTNLQVTKQSYADMIINNEIPVIREKWPVGFNCSKTVYIQHSNTSTHFGSNYVPLFSRCSYFGWMGYKYLVPCYQHISVIVLKPKV